MKKILPLLMLCIAFLSFTTITVNDIITNADKRDQGKNLSAKMTLIYKNGKGNVIKERVLDSKRVWADNSNENLILKFISPNEIKNSAFLSLKIADQLTQKLYLPSFGKIRIIGNSSRNTSFMGSDFYYSDLRSRNLLNDQNKLLKEENGYYYVEGVINETDKHPKRIYKINKDTWVTEEIKFFSTDCDSPSRIMEVKEVKKINGVYVLNHVVMTTFKGCSETISSSSEILLRDVDLSTPISEDIFSDRNLMLEEF